MEGGLDRTLPARPEGSIRFADKARPRNLAFSAGRDSSIRRIGFRKVRDAMVRAMAHTTIGRPIAFIAPVGFRATLAATLRASRTGAVSCHEWLASMVANEARSFSASPHHW